MKITTLQFKKSSIILPCYQSCSFCSFSAAFHFRFFPHDVHMYAHFTLTFQNFLSVLLHDNDSSSPLLLDISAFSSFLLETIW